MVKNEVGLRQCFTNSSVGSKALLNIRLSTFMAIHVVNISIKPF